MRLVREAEKADEAQLVGQVGNLDIIPSAIGNHQKVLSPVMTLPDLCFFKKSLWFL